MSPRAFSASDLWAKDYPTRKTDFPKEFLNCGEASFVPTNWDIRIKDLKLMARAFGSSFSSSIGVSVSLPMQEVLRQKGFFWTPTGNEVWASRQLTRSISSNLRILSSPTSTVHRLCDPNKTQKAAGGGLQPLYIFQGRTGGPMRNARPAITRSHHQPRSGKHP